MKIIRNTTEFNIPEKTVVTIGKFDGIHNGHVTILERMMEYRIKGYKTCVFTFDIPPSLMGFGSDKQIISTLYEKELSFAAFGIDYLVEFPFYEKTASISPRNFIEEFLVERLNAKAVVVGDDCTFGSGAKGNAQTLKDFGPVYDYEVEILSKLKVDDTVLSSTYIRQLLQESDVKRVAELSYRAYFANGKLRRGPSGFSRGLTIHNMVIPEEKLLPKPGVYYTKIFFDDALYPALTRVPPDKHVLNSYLYSDVKGIDRSTVLVLFLDKVREVMKFDSTKAVDEQVRKDIFEGQKWHREHPGDLLIDKYRVNC